MRFSFLFFASFILATLAVDFDQYNGYSVLRIRPDNEFQLASLIDLEENDPRIDFWKRPTRLERSADLMITPNNSERIVHYLQQRQIDFDVYIPDVRSLIEKEYKEMIRAEKFLKTSKMSRMDGEVIPGFWDNYQRFDKINEFMDLLEKQYDNLTKKISFGKSFENRPLNLIRIGESSSDNKPVVYIQGGIHAREWISPAFVTYFAQHLINGYNQGDKDIIDLLKTFDFHIVPVLNPDGYEFSHTNYRLWRKTRSTRSSSTCKGTDPNRNYGYGWGGSGTSGNPCSEIYRGEKPFSEPETKAESEYILKLGKRAKVLLAVHSYGQYWLYPWGNEDKPTEDDKDLNDKAQIATKALTRVHQTKFIYGTSAGVLYAAAGATDDWAYGNVGIKYSYTIELRDTGSYGFQLPPNQIKPTSEETTAGIIAMLLAIKTEL